MTTKEVTTHNEYVSALETAVRAMQAHTQNCMEAGNIQTAAAISRAQTALGSLIVRAEKEAAKEGRMTASQVKAMSRAAAVLQEAQTA